MCNKPYIFMVLQIYKLISKYILWEIQSSVSKLLTGSVLLSELYQSHTLCLHASLKELPAYPGVSELSPTIES